MQMSETVPTAEESVFGHEDARWLLNRCAVHVNNKEKKKGDKNLMRIMRGIEMRAGLFKPCYVFP